MESVSLKQTIKKIEINLPVTLEFLLPNLIKKKSSSGFIPKLTSLVGEITGNIYQR